MPVEKAQCEANRFAELLKLKRGPRGRPPSKRQLALAQSYADAAGTQLSLETSSDSGLCPDCITCFQHFQGSAGPCMLCTGCVDGLYCSAVLGMLFLVVGFLQLVGLASSPRFVGRVPQVLLAVRGVLCLALLEVLWLRSASHQASLRQPLVQRKGVQSRVLHNNIHNMIIIIGIICRI